MTPPTAAPRPARSLPRTLLLGALALVLLAGLAYLAKLLYDFVRDAYGTATYTSLNAPKALALAAVALILLGALPLAILEAVSDRRYRRAERDLRATRPDDAVTAYEGPEGRGLLFEGPGGRLLLLRPPGGFGKPRTHPLPAPPTPEEPPAEPAA